MIKNVIYYYFSPGKEVWRPQSVVSSVIGTLSLVFLYWCLFFILEFVIITLLKVFNLLSEPGFKLTFGPTLFHNLIVLGFTLPILEEIINRQWVVYSKHNIALPISVFVAALLHKTATNHYKVPLTENLAIGGFSGVIGLITYSAIYRFLNPFNDVLKAFWQNNQKVIVIFSAVIFGYLHLGNYVITKNLLLYSPIILGTYLIAGFLMGYLRVRYGFLYNCLFHITTNSAMLVFKFLIIHTGRNIW